MVLQLRSVLASLACTSMGVAACAQVPVADAATEIPITAHLSGTAFVTTKLDASVEFYKSILGYVERRRVQIDSEATTSVFGADPGTVVDYVVLVPAQFSEEAPAFPGLNFVGFSVDASLDLPLDPKRAPRGSELVMAFEVTGLDKIHEKVERDGIPVVTPIALSATGKSRTITILDPNGYRVQLYEYVAIKCPEAEG